MTYQFFPAASQRNNQLIKLDLEAILEVKSLLDAIKALIKTPVIAKSTGAQEMSDIFYLKHIDPFIRLLNIGAIIERRLTKEGNFDPIPPKPESRAVAVHEFYLTIRGKVNTLLTRYGSIFNEALAQYQQNHVQHRN